MRAALLFQWKEIGSKYWFLPSLMALGAIGLAFGAVRLDHALGAAWVSEAPLLYANEPSGARVLLSTIAGSMITVAGVTFSITTAAVATTASTFGPRLIANFMSDRGNQVTLGTFIATFVFCVMVLRTVRSEDESLTSFVPHVAILCALLLALASLAVLIYFIHHVPETIHISNVVARVGRQLHGSVEELFPEMLGPGQEEHEEQGARPKPGPPERAAEITSRATGYVRYIDDEGLLRQAQERDLLLHLARRPGDFVTADERLMAASPAERIDAEAREELRDTFVVGGYRSPAQDTLYLVDRLVEVAARALSPGMNDIFTARNAIDWLSGALANLARRRAPESGRRDGEGALRVVASPRTFREVANAVFDQLRPYVADDVNAAVHTMRALERVAAATRSPQRRAVLRRHAEALREASRRQLAQERDLAQVEAAFAAARRQLERPSPAPSETA